MKKRGLISALIMYTIISGSAFSQDDNPDLQRAKELESVEKILDTRIAEINKELAKYAILKGKKINRSPAQTIFKQDKDSLELISYEFISDEYGSAEVVGGVRKSVKLFFSGDNLNKIESTVIEENYPNKAKITTKVIDPSPGTDDHSDITIESIENDKEPYIVKLSEMQNTLSNPTRIKFKREFYWKHLAEFEVKYRYTKKYYQLYSTNNDYQTVEKLKNSLKY